MKAKATKQKVDVEAVTRRDHAEPGRAATSSGKPAGTTAPKGVASAPKSVTFANSTAISTAVTRPASKTRKSAPVVSVNAGLLRVAPGAQSVFLARRPHVNRSSALHRRVIMPSEEECNRYDRLIEEQGIRLDVPLAEAGMALAERNNEAYFGKWLWDVVCGSAVLVYGEGCHEKLLDDFADGNLVGSVSGVGATRL